jgi:hypothetical protein
VSVRRPLPPSTVLQVRVQEWDRSAGGCILPSTQKCARLWFFLFLLCPLFFDVSSHFLRPALLCVNEQAVVRLSKLRRVCRVFPGCSSAALEVTACVTCCPSALYPPYRSPAVSDSLSVCCCRGGGMCVCVLMCVQASARLFWARGSAASVSSTSLVTSIDVPRCLSQPPTVSNACFTLVLSTHVLLVGKCAADG